MSKYRTYKNGITGHRYKGYYIIQGEKKGEFQIWRKDASVYKDHIFDFKECEWLIDIATASIEEKAIVKQLYDMEIYQINFLLAKLADKQDKYRLTQREALIDKWAKKNKKSKIERQTALT